MRAYGQPTDNIQSISTTTLPSKQMKQGGHSYWYSIGSMLRWYFTTCLNFHNEYEQETYTIWNTADFNAERMCINGSYTLPIKALLQTCL